ncbi:hypothetical protein BS78_01G079300 [Paspalum vaginatum]|nr:hypothetical protein BS78_01G079300 [Paspalum vaginatum]
MLRNTWWSSRRQRSTSRAASWRYWISCTAASTAPLPCSAMAAPRSSSSPGRRRRRRADGQTKSERGGWASGAAEEVEGAHTARLRGSPVPRSGRGGVRLQRKTEPNHARVSPGRERRGSPGLGVRRPSQATGTTSDG